MRGYLIACSGQQFKASPVFAWCIGTNTKKSLRQVTHFKWYPSIDWGRESILEEEENVILYETLMLEFCSWDTIQTLQNHQVHSPKWIWRWYISKISSHDHMASCFSKVAKFQKQLGKCHGSLKNKKSSTINEHMFLRYAFRFQISFLGRLHT